MRKLSFLSLFLNMYCDYFLWLFKIFFLSLVCVCVGVCFVGGQCKSASMVYGVVCLCILCGYLCMHVFLFGGILCGLWGDMFVSMMYRDGFVYGVFLCCGGQLFGVFCFVGLALLCLTWLLLSLCLFWSWIYGMRTLLYQLKYLYLSHYFCFVSFLFSKIHCIFLLMLFKILLHFFSL